MKTLFVGTKLVKAAPMSRLEYNDYRGWEIPADEDPNDLGQLVEYLDGGKPNHPRHEGYISWSPEEVFANAYTEIQYDDLPNYPNKPDWLKRVLLEKAQLDASLGKLSAFLDKGLHDSVAYEQHNFMIVQRDCMQNYSDVLGNRIDAWKDTQDSEGG